MNRIAGLMLLCAISVFKAEAEEPKHRTARAFREACRASLDDGNGQNMFGQGFCLGVILAVNFESERLDRRLKSCSPRDTTERQLMTVALKFMDAHPDSLDLSLVEVANTAFQLEWPCK